MPVSGCQAAQTGGEVPGLPSVASSVPSAAWLLGAPACCGGPSAAAASSASLAALKELVLLPPRLGMANGGRRTGMAAVPPPAAPMPPPTDCWRRMLGSGGRGMLGTGCPPEAALIWPAAIIEAPTAAPIAGMLPAPTAEAAMMAPAAAAALMDAADAARGSPGPPAAGAVPAGCSTAAAEAGRASAFAATVDGAGGATPEGGTDSVVLGARLELRGVPPARSMAERVRNRRRCGGRCCTDRRRTAGTDCALSMNLRICKLSTQLGVALHSQP